MNRPLAWSVLLASVALGACGYHVAGHANVLPAIHTIAVPQFGNATTQYRIADRLSGAITRELIQRTRYKVVADPEQADAVLTGAVVNFFSNPTTYDPATNRASGVQVTVILQVSLKERSSGKVLFSRPNFEMHERYEISVDPDKYFDESTVAINRMSSDVARSVVSAVLEKF